MNKQKDFEHEIAALKAEVATIRQERNVNGFLSAVVRTSPEVFDAIMYSVAGGVIGIPAAIAWTAMGNDPAGTLYTWGACQSFGVTCAGVRLACAAIDLPLIIQGIAEKVLESRDRRDERRAQERDRSLQPFLLNDEGYSLPHPGPDIPLEQQLYTIRQRDSKHAESRQVPLGDLWQFLKVSFETNDWSRDGWGERWGKPTGWQALWADYKSFLCGPKDGNDKELWWRTTDRPTLERALTCLHYPQTNQTANERTNGA